MKNILSSDPSPYLQQHKNNPVHWQTWNKNTLHLAKTQKKPPYLLITKKYKKKSKKKQKTKNLFFKI